MKTIYVSEPSVIDLELVRKKLGGTLYTLIPGDPHFAGAPFMECEVILIRSATNVQSNIRGSFPRLKSVIRVGTGLDNVDTTFCDENGIAVYNAPGANAEAAAEYIVAVALYALRKLHLLTKEDITNWNRFKFVGQGITSQTVGIVGYGNIGKQLQHKLAGLGCRRFLVYDPYLPQSTSLPENTLLTTLDEVLSGSDIISLNLPLTPDTKYIIGEKNVGHIKKGALLINAARGGIVDEKELLQVIDDRQLTYIADCVENELKVNLQLLQHDRVVITPHIASLTQTSQENMTTLALDNFLASARLIDNKRQGVIPRQIASVESLGR